MDAQRTTALILISVGFSLIWHVFGRIMSMKINVVRVDGFWQSIMMVLMRGPYSFIGALSSHFWYKFKFWMEK